MTGHEVYPSSIHVQFVDKVQKYGEPATNYQTYSKKLDNANMSVLFVLTPLKVQLTH
jgi:hypothetical protein